MVHPALIQIPQMAKVHITLVKQGDFTTFETGAQFARPLVVMLGGRVHDDKTGQQTLQVQAHMSLGGGLAAAVLAQSRQLATSSIVVLSIT